MNDSPPYRLDIEGVDDPDGPGGAGSDFRDRPWIGIHFECCGVYARLYRNREETAYSGACPRCLGKVRVRVGPGGTDTRFFTAK